MAERPSALDASFLSLEERSAPRHAGTAAVLRRPRSGFDYDQLVALIQRRLGQAPRLMSRPLDRSRPLWEDYLVKGLARGRLALVTKTHQTLVDGDIGQLILAENPQLPEREVDDARSDRERPVDGHGAIGMGRRLIPVLGDVAGARSTSGSAASAGSPSPAPAPPI